MGHFIWSQRFFQAVIPKAKCQINHQRYNPKCNYHDEIASRHLLVLPARMGARLARNFVAKTINVLSLITFRC